MTGMTTDELVAVSQNHDSSDRTATKTIFNYLNINRSSNNRYVMEYCKFCYTEFAKCA